jgi:acyl-CoA thioester hydrolase
METGGADQPAHQPHSGRFDGVERRLPIRVYFEDTDLSGVVYHANYLRFMERGRSDMLRLAGIDQRAVFEAGEGAYAVASLAIRYRAPARLDDALVVHPRDGGARRQRFHSSTSHARRACAGRRGCRRSAGVANRARAAATA